MKVQNNITFIQGFSTTLPFDSDGFDHVLSTLFYHHLGSTEKEVTFHEIFRVLMPSGEVHIADYGPL
jgi:ubiquinone/menaquinone biosynthesis C-methylase UbiE